MDVELYSTFQIADFLLTLVIQLVCDFFLHYLFLINLFCDHSDMALMFKINLILQLTKINYVCIVSKFYLMYSVICTN